MTTEVIITGTGAPLVQPGIAGAGVLVRHGDLALQFDAGRNTCARIKEAGTELADLNAVFLTHYHSDHLVGLQDVVLTHWVQDFDDVYDPLDVVAPNGSTTKYCEAMLAPWDDDLEVRATHGAKRGPDPKMNLIGFDVPDEPTEVWARDGVRVLAGQVRHEPVIGAVGYRVETPDGVVVITGDTTVCPEVAELSQGADIVVYEAMRTQVVLDEYKPSMHYIIEYHADTVEIGEQMAALDIPMVMLTHLLPTKAFFTGRDDDGFEADVRAGGYAGRVMVCDDLAAAVLEDGMIR